MKNVLNYSGKVALRAAALAGIALLPLSASAGEVTLKSADGTVNLVGEFIDFREDNYIIRTALGDLRIAASRVRCEGADCPSFETSTADVMIAGSDTVGLGLMPLLMSGFASYLDAEATVSNTQQTGQILANFVGDGGFGDELGSYLVTSTSSGDAFSTLLSGDAHIGMASRRIRPAEARELRDGGFGNMVSPNQEHIVAVDSLVVIAHPSNPVEKLSIEDLQRIYSGDVTNWSQLGGPDLPITVIDRQESSGTYGVFKGRIYGGEEPAAIPSAQIANDNSVAARLVNETPGAIGYVGYAFQRGAKALNVVNECGIEVTPDAFSAATEEYDLQRRLYLYSGQNVDEKTRKFLEFAESPDADGVVAKAGFIDLGIRTRSQGSDSARANALLNASADAFEANVIGEMMSEMSTMDRLSTTFRFRTGSSKLDERGLIDLERLTSYLETKPAGTKVKIVGFTDDVGAFEANRSLSFGRANQVLTDLRNSAGDRLSNISFSATGFGEISPASCNTSETGRGINRRVEVWIEAGATG